MTALVAFLIGYVLPSPFPPFGQSVSGLEVNNMELCDTLNMIVEGESGGTYEGSVIKGTSVRQGYGTLTQADGTVYEGDWKDDELPYGIRTTSFSIYRGEFDCQLRNDGFGIVTYKQNYVDRERQNGKRDDEILYSYIGNWKKDLKEGIGRAIKVDNSMDFGYYHEGLYQVVDGANYRIGGSVYGVDVSHHQQGMDWNNLALWCDRNGNVSGKEKDDQYRFMQPVFFAYIKATEGATFIDDTYNDKTIQAERHAIVKGAYHFLHLTSDIDMQVQLFTSVASYSEGDLPPALDIEVEKEIEDLGEQRLFDMMFTWLEKVEEIWHVRPVIYTNERIRNKYLIHDPRFTTYDCWIARYNTNGPDNKEWKIWQLAEGRANGLKGQIDIDLYKDDYQAFQMYLNDISK